MKLNYSESYKILKVESDTDWNQLRRSYKTLIQQSHPDRFTENSAAHLAAEKAIREYNAAYKLLADYYQTYGKLPSATASPANSSPTEAQPARKKRPGVTRNENNFKAKSNKPPSSKTFKYFFTASIAGLGYLVFILLSQIPEIPVAPASLTKQTNITQSIEPISKPHTNTGSLRQQHRSQENFSIGSSLGEVILIQGEPSKVEGDTWFYGKSRVEFSNGVVSNWYRDPANPLNAVMQEKSINGLSSSELIGRQTEEATSPGNSPYWDWKK